MHISKRNYRARHQQSFRLNSILQYWLATKKTLFELFCLLKVLEISPHMYRDISAQRLFLNFKQGDLLSDTVISGNIKGYQVISGDIDRH